MSKRKIVHDYMISDTFWMKIKPLLPLPKPKKKSGRPGKDNKIILVVFSIFFLVVANGNYFQEFMELQALSKINFRNGEEQDSLRAYG